MATYTVKAGDSLSRIATSLGITWRELYDLNRSVIGSDPNMIRPGMVFQLPGSAPPAASTPTSPSGEWKGTTNDLVNVPEPSQAQVWYDTKSKKYYLAWQVPGTDVPLLYEVDDPKAIVGLGKTLHADYSGTMADFNRRGAVIGGIDYDIMNRNEHPFNAWASQVERQSQTRPWMRDKEVLALMLEGFLEGRPIDPAEFETTNWWRTHNEAQRQWLTVSEADPMEAARLRAQNRGVIEGMLQAAGINNASPELVGWISDQFTNGNWDQAYTARQIKAISDPASRIGIDPQLKTHIGAGLDVTHGREEEVRDNARRWLGPAFGTWTEDQIKNWAGKLRNDPDAEQALEKMLAQQRLAILPEYKDPSLSYEDIAGPWRQLAFNMWGEQPDENDPLFTQILRMNDATEAAKLLRREGIARNKPRVIADMTKALGTAQGGGVRSAIG